MVLNKLKSIQFLKIIYDSEEIRTLASGENGALNHRLRPLGHTACVRYKPIFSKILARDANEYIIVENIWNRSSIENVPKILYLYSLYAVLSNWPMCVVHFLFHFWGDWKPTSI